MAKSEKSDSYKEKRREYNNNRFPDTVITKKKKESGVTGKGEK